MGQEVGLSAILPEDPVFRVAPITALADLRPHSHAGTPDYVRSDNTPPPPTRITLPSGGAKRTNGGRWGIILAVMACLIVVLFLTNLWIILVLMMLNGTTRSWLSGTLKPMALKVKAWADGG
jgi:hypothetical protein